MNEIVIINPDDFDNLPTEELRRELVRCLALTAQNLYRMALLVKTLEGRGEDLSGLKIGMVDHLRDIARGTLLPETVVSFASKPSLIKTIGRLPIPEQKRLASGGTVLLVVYNEEGQRTHRPSNPLDMLPAQVRQVFDGDHIRTEQQQHLLLDEKNKNAARPLPERAGKLRIDRERDGFYVGNHFVSAADARAALSLLRK